jgi:hypothetical protein
MGKTLNAEAEAMNNVDSAGRIDELAKLDKLAYEQRREGAAKELGVRVGALDQLIKDKRRLFKDDDTALPHWKVESSPEAVNTATLLKAIREVFRRYVVLPKGADIALPLWVLHAWTMDAGDISPFIVLVSPTKRCGKTTVLILLYFMTPRSELAGNITPSAVFRYVEQVRPTLLIDEADSFMKDNEELRGILDAGHTRLGATVIRNVEVDGQHMPRRFSVWAPKAIASIRSLADTLEDRSVIITLRRKQRTAKVERLRRRDTKELAGLRNQAARWAADNFDLLTDPDPQIPPTLNDRAADNWRPLLAIADLAGGRWSEAAREAACRLSGDDQDDAANVGLLRDIRTVLGDAEAIRSADLVDKLTADPEKPWAEWKRGKPLTQKQLAGLLKPFGIISETVRLPGLADAKGYMRVWFEEAWESYCPLVKTPSNADSPIPKRPSVQTSMESAQHDDFRSVQKGVSDGSENGNLSLSHEGLDAWTDQKRGNGVKGHSDHESGTGKCAQCGGDDGAPPTLYRGADYPPEGVLLHRECLRFWLQDHHLGGQSNGGSGPPEDQTQQGMPFAMTRLMRERLRSAGYSADAIHNMTPGQAHEALTRSSAATTAPVRHAQNTDDVEF